MAASAPSIDTFWSLTEADVRPEQGAATAQEAWSLSPPWLRRARDRISGLLALANDWNSYGAAPPSAEAVQEALTLLDSLADLGAPEPVIVPTARRGIQLEWSVNGVALEVESLGGGRFLAVFEDETTGDEWDAELVADLSRVNDAIQRLASAR